MGHEPPQETTPFGGVIVQEKEEAGPLPLHRADSVENVEVKNVEEVWYNNQHMTKNKRENWT